MPAFAPPEDQPIVGYWGEPTSTLDFCEENYVVNFYMAEFCKLLARLLYSVWGKNLRKSLCREHHHKCIGDNPSSGWSWRSGLERRYIVSYILLTGHNSGYQLSKPRSGWNWVIVIPWITSVSHAGEWIEYYKRIKFVSYIDCEPKEFSKGYESCAQFFFVNLSEFCKTKSFEYYAAPADLESANLVSDFAILAMLQTPRNSVKNLTPCFIDYQ